MRNFWVRDPWQLSINCLPTQLTLIFHDCIKQFTISIYFSIKLSKICVLQIWDEVDEVYKWHVKGALADLPGRCACPLSLKGAEECRPKFIYQSVLHACVERRLHSLVHSSIHSIPFHSIPCHAMPFHSIPFHSIPSIHLFIHWFIHSFIHSVVHSFIHSFIHSFTHSAIDSLNHGQAGTQFLT